MDNSELDKVPWELKTEIINEFLEECSRANLYLVFRPPADEMTDREADVALAILKTMREIRDDQVKLTNDEIGRRLASKGFVNRYGEQMTPEHISKIRGKIRKPTQY